MVPRPIIPLLAVAMLAHTHARASDPEAGSTPAPRTEKTTCIGVATTAATPIVREQLGLPRGVGVAVDAVDADGPAMAAGVAQHDIITKLDDQLIVNIEQFSVLVRLHHPGEVVKLGLIRHGKPLTVNVTLAERQMAVGGDEVVAMQKVAPRAGHLSSVVTHADGTHLITLTSHGDDDRRVKITDNNGKLIFEGPLNTAEDEAAVPEDVRPKVQQIEKNFEHFKQLRNGMLGIAPPPPPIPPQK